MRTDVVSAIRDELVQNIDEKAKNSVQHFFKEEIKIHGVKASIVKNIAKTSFQEIKNKDKKEIFSLCETLLKSDYVEEAFIAFEWAYALRKKYEPSDFYVFGRWVQKYVN